MMNSNFITLAICFNFSLLVYKKGIVSYSFDIDKNTGSEVQNITFWSNELAMKIIGITSSPDMLYNHLIVFTWLYDKRSN